MINRKTIITTAALCTIAATAAAISRIRTNAKTGIVAHTPSYDIIMIRNNLFYKDNDDNSLRPVEKIAYIKNCSTRQMNMFRSASDLIAPILDDKHDITGFWKFADAERA